MEIRWAGEGGTMWRIELKSGGMLGIWAGSYHEEDGQYVFDLDVLAGDAERKGAIVISQAPAQPEWISIAVASVPVADVKEILTTSWDKVPAEPIYA